jgi:NAD(P)-dependent dehydrogenase (short-subunit alcohol dehydrogenase family)
LMSCSTTLVSCTPTTQVSLYHDFHQISCNSHDSDAIDTPEKIWDLTHNINVKGVWFGSKHAVQALRKHNKTKGSIINTASIVALVGAATPQLAYTASKGAVLAMTRELAIVHAREGFRFNALCPAPLNTPLLQDWLGDDQAKRQRREIHFPTGRFGEAIEQAHAVVFLASDESSFVNGTDFVVDGGMTKVCRNGYPEDVLAQWLIFRQAYVTPEGPPAPAPTNLAK